MAQAPWQRFGSKDGTIGEVDDDGDEGPFDPHAPDGPTSGRRQTGMKWFVAAFLALYLAAFALYLIGTFGWFGQEPGPLAGVFLIPLGLPWNLLGDKLGLAGPALGLMSPAINAGLLTWLWRRRSPPSRAK